MSKEFPKCVIVIIGEWYKPDNPNWTNDGAVWFVNNQRELDLRIAKERSTLASAIYDESKDDGYEWSEIVSGTTYYLCEDFDTNKHFKII